MLVTVDAAGTLLDRRRVDLVDEGLPKIPHHVEAQSLPVDEAVVLIERVRLSAERCAQRVLDDLAASVALPIGGIALRECPELPPTIAERITNYRARNAADWVMYRRALASAAESRGWAVHWFNPRKLTTEAPDLRRVIGPPWGQDHKLAMSAAIDISR